MKFNTVIRLLQNYKSYEYSYFERLKNDIY